MLQDIRDNAQGLVAKIIIGLIVVSFSLFGVESLLSGGSQTNAAVVNGEDITLTELEQAIYFQKQRILGQLGDDANPAMLDDATLRSPSLERLIQRKLVLLAAADANIGISEDSVNQLITSRAEFQDGGQFSPVIYQNILRSNGYTPTTFKQTVTDDFIASQLNQGFAGSNFVTPSDTAQTAELIGQKRNFNYVLFDPAKIADTVSVSDEQAKAYFDANQDQFMTEETVTLSYIEIKQQDFASEIDEQAIRDAYDEDMSEFEADEERRAAHILFEINDERNAEQTLALATDVSTRLAAGENFAELATALSDDLGSASNGGDLGFTKGQAFPKKFEEALFELALNEISAPVKTEAGYHLITATEIAGLDKPTYEERRNAIKQRLQLSSAQAEFVETIENLKDLVFNSENLTDPASDLNLTVKTSDAISRDSATGSLAHPAVLTAAFAEDVLIEGNNSDVLELTPDHFIVVRVDQHKPAEVKAFADVKGIIIEARRSELVTAKTLSSAEQLVTDLQAGASDETVAAAAGAPWIAVSEASRNTATVNRELLNAAFGMSAPGESKSYQAVALANGNVAVIRLDSIKAGRWEDFSAPEQNGIKAELGRGYGNQSFQNLMLSLKNAADIEIM